MADYRCCSFGYSTAVWLYQEKGGTYKIRRYGSVDNPVRFMVSVIGSNTKLLYEIGLQRK